MLAQKAAFTLSVNKDTVLMNNIIKVEYTLKQVESDHFETPEFPNFQIVSGPNTSSSVSYINGDVSRESSFSFYLKPDSPGTWTIPAVFVNTEEGLLSTQAKDIVVLPNPDGIQEETEPMNRQFDFFFNQSPTPPTPASPPSPPARKKRKTYRL